MDALERRTFLAYTAGGLGGLAGCAGRDSADGETLTGASNGSSATSDAPTGSSTANDTETATDGVPDTASETPTETASLDRREANVVDVTVTAEGDDAYRFDVTLDHDDAGEDGYANWWQVETLGGERVGRRELLHAHSEQPFTRSATISVTSSVDCVVVRGHDETHGYGGQAMLVTLATGETAVLRQGSARELAATLACPGTQ